VTTPDNARPRVLALGNAAAGDDGAALAAARRLGPGYDVDAVGRPGAGLLDLLAGDRPVVLVDVVQSGAAPGTIHRLPLAALPQAALARAQVSSHGFGPAEALELAQVLGRPLPPGRFVGVEGAAYDPGAPLSLAVEAAVEPLAAAIRAAVAELAS